MKKFFIPSLVIGNLLLVIGSAAAAPTMTLYYSPTCPHCHHARDFINGTLKHEYPMVEVTEVNVAESKNGAEFLAVVKKCDLPGGYIPVAVIGEKCFQGFGEPSPSDYRAAIDEQLTDQESTKAAAAKKSFADPSANAAEAVAAPVATKPMNSSMLMLYALGAIVLVALGFVLFSKKKK